MMSLCNITGAPVTGDFTGSEGCILTLNHLGPHYWREEENVPLPPTPVVHLAVSGMPVGTMSIDHPSGTCVFCDAERYRSTMIGYVDPEAPVGLPRYDK